MKKLASNRSYRPDDTTVVVHVQDRSERDFVKRFDELDIEWSILEQQLVLWSNLFRAGRRLRIEITFNYIQTSGGAGVTTKRGTKRGFASTSERMLAQRDMHLAAEEGSSGQPSICQQVYATFRCPGPPCHVGPYCWQDKDTKKRYRLKTHHFKALIEHVEQGGTLLDHDDVPSSLREQLFAEDQQRLEEQQRKATSRASCPPISITNIMPNAGLSPAPESVAVSATASTSVSRPLPSAASLEIPGPRDIAEKDYCNWHCLQVEHLSIKQEFPEHLP